MSNGSYFIDYPEYPRQARLNYVEAARVMQRMSNVWATLHYAGHAPLTSPRLLARK